MTEKQDEWLRPLFFCEFRKLGRKIADAARGAYAHFQAKKQKAQARADIEDILAKVDLRGPTFIGDISDETRAKIEEADQNAKILEQFTRYFAENPHHVRDSELGLGMKYEAPVGDYANLIKEDHSESDISLSVNFEF